MLTPHNKHKLGGSKHKLGWCKDGSQKLNPNEVHIYKETPPKEESQIRGSFPYNRDRE